MNKKLNSKIFLPIKDWDRKEYGKNAITGILGGAITSSFNHGAIFLVLGDLLLLLGLVCGVAWITMSLSDHCRNIKATDLSNRFSQPIRFYLRNHYKLFFIILLLIFAFFWFQIRPMVIKKECSYVKEYISAVPAITQTEIDQTNYLYNTCIHKYPGTTITSGHTLLGYTLNSSECAALDLARNQSPHPAIAPKIIQLPADTTTYKYCIHSHGL